MLEQLDQEGLLVPADPRVGPGALAAAAPPLAPVHRRPAPGRGRGRGRRADPRRRPARPAAGRARCCTTSARAGPATTASSGSPSRPEIAHAGWASRRRTSPSLAALVRHHLLLPATATRRDIDDPATIDRVAATIGARRRASSSCCTPSPRPTARRPARRRGRRGRRTWWRRWSARVQAEAGRRSDARARAGAAPHRAAGRPRRTGDRRHRGRRRRPAGHHRRPRPARAAQHLRRGARAQPARRPRREDVGRGRPRHRGLRRAPALRAGRRCRRSWPTACAPRWRARCRWPTGCASARPTTARTAPGRRRRGSPGTTARSAAPRPASSRSGPATGPGCSTGSPRRSPGRGSTSRSARIETLGADAVDCFYVCNPSGSPVEPTSGSGSRAALVRRPPGGARPAAGGRPTRRARSPVLSVGACDRRRSRDGTVPLAWSREESSVDSRLVALPHLWRRHRLRAAALRRRAHRRRRRVPGVGLRRLRHGAADRRRAPRPPLRAPRRRGGPSASPSQLGAASGRGRYPGGQVARPALTPADF